MGTRGTRAPFPFAPRSEVTRELRRTLAAMRAAPNGCCPVAAAGMAYAIADLESHDVASWEAIVRELLEGETTQPGA